MSTELIKRIRELAEPIVIQHDMFIVDCEINHGKEAVVWLYVDSEKDGVTVDSCSEISRELSFLMDAHELLTSGYRLNVSSPGVTRPLEDRRQFVKNCGRKARIKYKTGNDYNKLTGILKQVTGESIEIEETGGNLVVIPFEDLVETTIIPTFDR